MPRPSSFKQKTADAICERLAEGDSLRAICLDEEMPAKATVFKWLQQQPAFADQYARAREFQGEGDADDIGDVAAKVQAGDIAPDVGRVVIDAKKWSAGKRRPKVYGEKLTTEHTGPGGGPVEITRVERVVVNPSDPDR